MNLFWAYCISDVREATRGKCGSAAHLSTQVFGGYYLLHFPFSGGHLLGVFRPSLFCHWSAKQQPLSCSWSFPLIPARRMWERYFRLRGTRSGDAVRRRPGTLRLACEAPARGGAWASVGVRGGPWGFVGVRRGPWGSGCV